MPARPRRRAVGPPGARPPEGEPRVEPEQTGAQDEAARDEPGLGDDERLRAERPPHHDRGV